MSLRADENHRALWVPVGLDFMLVIVGEDGRTHTTTTLDEEDAIDLLRRVADEIEVDGLEDMPEEYLS